MTRLSGRRKLLAALAIALVIGGLLIAVLGGSGRPPAGRDVPGQPAQRGGLGGTNGGGRGEAGPGGRGETKGGGRGGTGQGGSGEANEGGRGEGGRAGLGDVAIAARYLGVSPAQLRASLRSGSSLAVIAASRGRSVAGLEQRLVAARIAARRHALSELPPQQQQLVRARIQRSVAVSVKRRRLGSQILAGVNLRVAARYLGVKPRGLRTQLSRGRTLAQIAASTPGRNASGLIAALLAARKTLLDRARAAGEISAALEQRALTRLKSRITASVNHPPGR
jgi:hypothetical protein